MSLDRLLEKESSKNVVYNATNNYWRLKSVPGFEKYDEDYIKGYEKLSKEYPERVEAINIIRGDQVKNYGSLLDIGVGDGKFLDSMFDKGYRVAGCDVNPYAAEHVSHRMYSDLKDTNKYDSVTMFDVIEHIDDIVGFLTDVKDNHLTDNGEICFSTPNITLNPETSGSRHYKPNEHIWYFNKDSLNHLADSIGMKLVDVNYNESAIRQNPEHQKNIISGRFVTNEYGLTTNTAYKNLIKNALGNHK